MRPLRLLLAVPLVLPVAAALPAAAAPAPGQTPAATAPSPAQAPLVAAPGQAIKDSYIVVLREGTDATGFVRSLGVRAKHVYSSALDGFAATLTPQQLERVRRDPAVQSVEQDQVAQADQTQGVGTGLYGLDRTDQRALPLSSSYSYATVASTVKAYVIDTGIATAHPTFNGRATNVYDALGGNGQDCNGHGTHVAGTVGSSTYGIAKGVQLKGVRVLGCDGSGSISGIVAAVDWVRANAQRPAIANMSLGGGYSGALNTAVGNLSASGVFVAVAAGNENQNACNVSPASAPAATTVAASDRYDTRASFSNYGSCVDTYAPGVAVLSTWLSGTTKTISGTSMASPHVAGVAALYKATYGDAASSTVDSWIKNNATAGVVKSNLSGTANRLLFKAAL